MINQESAVSDGTSQASSEEMSKNEQRSEAEKQFVAYETHQKLLGQRKKDQSLLKEFQDKLAKYEQRDRELEERKAVEAGEFDKALKGYKEKISTLENRIQSYETSIEEGTKLNAFLDKLPGSIKKRDYLKFVDTSEIVIDPETGMADDLSVERVVNTFIKEFPDLYAPKGQRTLPNVGSVNSKGMYMKDLNSMSREELKRAYLAGKFKQT